MALSEMLEKKATYTAPVNYEWLSASIGMLYLGNPLVLAQQQVERRQGQLDKVRLLLRPRSLH